MSRFAFTREYSQRTGEERTVLFEMDEAPEFAPGWRQAAVILTPSFTFGAFAEKPLRQGETIQWFPQPPLPEHLKFYVVVGEHPQCDLNLTDHVGEVGHMRLTNGRIVGVVADSRPADVDFARIVRDDLERAVNTPGAYPFTYEVVEAGFAFFLDLAVMLTTP